MSKRVSLIDKRETKLEATGRWLYLQISFACDAMMQFHGKWIL